MQASHCEVQVSIVIALYHKL